ncbi:MAG TPA: TolC family protein [Polyangiaceae bacterium]|jgi:outer membrane protein TolC
MPFGRALGAVGLASILSGSAIARAQQSAPAGASPSLVKPTPDEAPSPPPAIGFAQAVRLAVERNPTAIVAYEEIAHAVALVEQTRASSLPIVSGVGEYIHLEGLFGAQVPALAAANELSANLTISVPIVAPKSWAQWSHASDNVDAARASAADVRRTVAVSVARAYLAVVAQKRVIDAAVRARDTDRAHYDFAHQRHAGGIGNLIDEVRSNQQLQSDEANVEAQYANLVKDREALGVLVAVGGPLDAEEPNLVVEGDPQRAMADAEKRTDVVVADVRLKAAEHTVRDDWTDYSPFFTGVVTGFYENPQTPTLPSAGWQASLVLTIPLYDGGLRYGQAKERAVLRDEARAGVDAVLREARSDVRVAFEELTRADSALASARRAAELAHQALDLSQVAYRAGAFTDIEVIDAERTARDADTAVAVAEDGSRQARLDLLAATGRFP